MTAPSRCGKEQACDSELEMAPKGSAPGAIFLHNAMSITTAQDEAIAAEINERLPDRHARVWLSRMERDGSTVHECIFEYGHLRRYDSAPMPFYDVDEVVSRFRRWFAGAEHRMYLRQWVDHPDDADDEGRAPWND